MTVYGTSTNTYYAIKDHLGSVMAMTMTFKEEVQRLFPYLFEKWGFVFVDTNEDFGGNIAIAQSGQLQIRFIRDRADFFLDISRVETPEKMAGFYSVLDSLKAKGRITHNYKYCNKMAAVSKLLGQNYQVIQEYFLSVDL